MEPETRSLLGWEFENPDVYNQTAIPWCTEHDVLANGASVRNADGSVHYWDCWLAVRGGVDGTKCVISTGGPDHKWWKDA